MLHIRRTRHEETTTGTKIIEKVIRISEEEEEEEILMKEATSTIPNISFASDQIMSRKIANSDAKGAKFLTILRETTGSKTELTEMQIFQRRVKSLKRSGIFIVLVAIT